MGKTIQRSSNAHSVIITRTSIVAALGGFMGGLGLFTGLIPMVTLVFSVGTAVTAAIVTNALLSIVWAPKSEIESTFNFGEDHVNEQKGDIDFEYEIAGLIHKLTGNRTEIVDDSADGGIDIKVYAPDGELVGIVQCQNLAPHKTTHPAYIRDLNTVRHSQQVKTAYLVSKGRFSEESQKLAQQLDVKLIDGSALTKLRRQTA